MPKEKEEHWMWIVTGPSGAGKSTVWKRMGGEFQSIPYFNPDEEALRAHAQLPPGSEQTLQKTYAEVARDFEKNRIEQYREQGRSFGFEKSTPGAFTFNQIRKFKKKGWKIGVIAVGVANEGQAEERTHARVQEGGHEVWPFVADINYHTSFTGVPKLISLSDRALVYDNSGSVPVLVAERTNAEEPLKLRIEENSLAPENTYMRRMLTRLREEGLLESQGRKR